MVETQTPGVEMATQTSAGTQSRKSSAQTLVEATIFEGLMDCREIDEIAAQILKNLRLAGGTQRLSA